MMTMLSKAYSITPVRLIFKFLVCLTGVKIGGDFFYYLIGGTTLTFPRYSIQEQFGQAPLNPPVKQPYPIQLTAKNIQQIRNFQNYHLKLTQTLYHRDFMIQKMYKNNPQRQNKDQIDHFSHYCQAQRILQDAYIRALKKMSNSGTKITQGINQKIRQLSQFQFDNLKSQRVTPLL